MGMTIEEAIEIISDIDKAYRTFSNMEYEAMQKSIEIMRKYQKIKEILNSVDYTENGTLYSYTYDEDSRVKHIREVIEDGNNN